MPRAQCQFYTAKLVRCSRGCDAGVDYCRTHQPKAVALGPRPAEGHCPCVRRVGGADQWCGRPNLAGDTLCVDHHNRLVVRIEEEERNRQRNRLEEEILNAYLAENPRQIWAAVARHLWARSRLPPEAPAHVGGGLAYVIARRYFLRTTPEDMPVQVFNTFWQILWEQEQGIWRADDIAWLAAQEGGPAVPPAPPMGQMGRLAADGQNVHTAPVAKQTNSNVDLLLAEEPVGLDTLATVTRWWTETRSTPFEDYWKVMNDMHHWYHKRTCKATGDFLYKRVLDGLVYKILNTDPFNETSKELFQELVKRLWEECEEAVGMCCEGHISRLANVLVGFDETFRPPVPVGEILQTKMAAIAEMKLSHKLKLHKAVAVMDELKIPLADRAPWLEALEE